MGEAAVSGVQREFRDVLGHYPTGVVVVSAIVDGAPVGMVVGTFASVSLDPPLVSFMPAATSTSYPRLRGADAVTISVLAHDQGQVCRTLASKDEDKFEKVSWRLSPFGTPLIDGAVAHVHGHITEEVLAGDHYIVLIGVDDLHVARPVAPLLFFQGGYGAFSASGLSAHLDQSLISAARVAEAARPQLDRLSHQFDCSAAAVIQISTIDHTVGATSYGPQVVVDERIGVRIPLIPPLGESAVAWDPSQLDQWLSRVSPATEESIAYYRECTERVREQGYSVSRIDTDPAGYQRLEKALAEYAQSELTPARERAIRDVIASSRHYFGGTVRSEEVDLNLASVMAPVFDPDATEPTNSGLLLRLGNLQQRVDGTTALLWINELKRAASEVSETLRTTARRDYSRYTLSSLRSIE